jgi:beta-galactosidase
MTPQLYTLRARLRHADTLLDEVSVTFGVRRAVFKADGGFELNDAPLQIRGFCNHETFGGTGSAIPPRVNGPGRRGRLSALRVSLYKSILYGAFVWARRALNSRKWRFPARAEYRVATLKRMGANGWRGAHEPPAEDLLDATDALGFLVWVENREFGQEVDGYLPQERTMASLSLSDYIHLNVLNSYSRMYL